MKPLVLVACCGQKLDHAAPAKDLYVSDLFKKSRAYAERFGAEWFILSAKHGLIEPDAVIEPYDERLQDMPRPQWQAWGANVRRQVLGLGHPDTQRPPLTILAGRFYSEWAYTVPHSRPMRGLGIGQQKAWLKAALS